MTVLQPTAVGGRYRLGEPIGRGGMADVYSAYDEALDRTVAVKLLRNAADPMHRARFGAEASTLGTLNHPHIVTLLDAGLDEDVPFLVMDLVEGSTLSKHAAGGPLDRDWVRRVGAQVAEALAHAHAHGVVHRDVKPSNILIDEQGQAFLSDFGIARLLGSVDRHTRADELVGSPAFLAPEQVEAGELTAAVDVYSLGLVLLEALTGVRAYPGSPVEAAIARLRVAPLIPTSLGPDLGRLLEQMTRLNPEDRPTAAEVARALNGREPALPAQTESTGTLSLMTAQATATTPRSRRRPLIAAGIAAAALAAVLLPVAVFGHSDEVAASAAPAVTSTKADAVPVAAHPRPVRVTAAAVHHAASKHRTQKAAPHKAPRPSHAKKAPAGHHGKRR